MRLLGSQPVLRTTAATELPLCYPGGASGNRRCMSARHVIGLSEGYEKGIEDVRDRDPMSRRVSSGTAKAIDTSTTATVARGA